MPEGDRAPSRRVADVVVGVGAATTAAIDEVDELVRRALADADIGIEAVRAVATIEGRVDHPAIRALPWPAVGFSSDALAAVEVPGPSESVERSVGTASVAEAAALLAGGEGAQLIVPKQRSPHATVAIAQALSPLAESHQAGATPPHVHVRP